MPPPLPKPKTVYKAATGTTQGAGAKALVTVVPPPKPTWFFSAKATDNNGLTSNYAPYIWITNKVGVATLAWDYPTSTNVITNFTAYAGQVTNTYTRTINTGTNRTAVFPLTPTNMVISVSALVGTNLGYSLNLKNWTLIGATNYSGTNVNRPFWRAYGTKTAPGKASMSVSHQY